MQHFADASITESDVLQAFDDIGHDPSADEVADILAKLDTASINASQDRSQALRDAVSSVIHEADLPPPVTIHLPKRPESQAVAEIYATYPRNPIDSRQVVLVAEINGSQETLAVVNAYPDIDGGIHLSELVSLEARKGFGTAALKIILDTADRHNESVHLVAKKIGTNKTMLSTTALRDWYARHGFEVLGGSAADGYDMTRLPRPELVEDNAAEDGVQP